MGMWTGLALTGACMCPVINVSLSRIVLLGKWAKLLGYNFIEGNVF